MFNKLEACVLSEYKRSRAAPLTFCTLIKHYFSFIKHYIKYFDISHSITINGIQFGIWGNYLYWNLWYQRLHFTYIPIVINVIH
jgi:hypothetical protein